MKKNEVKISENGVKYYEIDGENGKEKVYVDEFNEYVFYPFSSADPDTQNRAIAYLKETQPALLEEEYFFYEVFLPIYQIKMFVVSNKNDMYVDIDDASMPVLFETKKYWVCNAVKDYFYTNINEVRSETYHKYCENHDIWAELRAWMSDNGLKDEFEEIVNETPEYPFDVMSRLPW